jgi:hypothetical protein
MTEIDRELPTSTSNNVIAATNTDVDVAANDVEIPMLRSTIDALLVSTRSENVDESTTGSSSD